MRIIEKTKELFSENVFIQHFWMSVRPSSCDIDSMDFRQFFQNHERDVL